MRLCGLIKKKKKKKAPVRRFQTREFPAGAEASGVVPIGPKNPQPKFNVQSLTNLAHSEWERSARRHEKGVGHIRF